MNRIPLLPITTGEARRISHYFLGVGETVSRMFPSMALHLQQSQLHFDPREWTGLAVFVASVYALLAFYPVVIIVAFANKVFMAALGLGIAASAGVGLAVFFYFAKYPSLAIKKKIRDIDANISHVLRHMLVEVRSGVTMYNSMNSVASGGYGQLSEEFKRAVKDIATGSSEIAALERLAFYNPSLFFRRVIWQMVNALKSGADIGHTLKQIVDSIVEEQKTAIKKYGSELNPLSLFYMMLVVIFPTLGIVFLLVVLSFVGSASVNIETVLLLILGVLAVVQVMFTGLIKNKRPVGI